MEPVRERERERFGDSAKARIPLLILGQEVPKGVLDDRLFQQADLLRMLDRALTPGASLSPFAMWVERYVFVYGVASNASTLQMFEATDMGRRGYRLNLRGAEIEWVDRPADACQSKASFIASEACSRRPGWHGSAKANSPLGGP